MKIIDFACKGNMVRFYLGKDSDTEYYGDDWDDTPYESNAGRVYEEYITGVADLIFPYGALVLEPCDGVLNSRYCKEDMKAGVVPCIIVIPGELAEESYRTEFDYWVGCKEALKFYMNDRMEPTTEPALYRFDMAQQRFCRDSYTVFVTKRADDAVDALGGTMEEVPIWKKSNLTIPEAAAYFGIGQNRLSALTKTRNCNFVLHVGNKRLIKRKQFEEYLEGRSHI